MRGSYLFDLLKKDPYVAHVIENSEITKRTVSQLNLNVWYLTNREASRDIDERAKAALKERRNKAKKKPVRDNYKYCRTALPDRLTSAEQGLQVVQPVQGCRAACTGYIACRPCSAWSAYPAALFCSLLRVALPCRLQTADACVCRIRTATLCGKAEAIFSTLFETVSLNCRRENGEAFSPTSS